MVEMKVTMKAAETEESWAEMKDTEWAEKRAEMLAVRMEIL